MGCAASAPIDVAAGGGGAAARAAPLARAPLPVAAKGAATPTTGADSASDASASTDALNAGREGPVVAAAAGADSVRIGDSAVVAAVPASLAAVAASSAAPTAADSVAAPATVAAEAPAPSAAEIAAAVPDSGLSAIVPAPTSGTATAAATPAAGDMAAVSAAAAPPAAAADTEAPGTKAGESAAPMDELVLPQHFLHFNDVYELGSSTKGAEPVGGVARFATLVSRLRARVQGPRPLLLFSGDALSPSLLSTVMRGRQMVGAFNLLGVDVAAAGNHDLDWSAEHFATLCGAAPVEAADAADADFGAAASATFSFPWLLSNVRVRATGRPLGEAMTSFLVRCDSGPFRAIGFIGLWENEILTTLATCDPALLDFEPAAEAAQRLCAELAAAGCDFVIALTHMRRHNDDALARAAVPGLHLILGGHDHNAQDNLAEASASDSVTPLLKSGTDFRNLSEVRVSRRPLPPRTPVEGAGGFLLGSLARGGLFFDFVRFGASSAQPEEPQMARLCAGYEATLGAKMESVIGLTKVALDARFASVRSRESAVGNLVADLMRQACRTDVALLNSGTLRADCIMGPGPLKMRDLVQLLPLQDSIVTVRMCGRLLLACLENGVSQSPRLEGRFLQVSGIRFEFDSVRAPGARVNPASVFVRVRPPEAASSAAGLVVLAEDAPTDSEEEEVGGEGDTEREGRRSKAAAPVGIAWALLAPDALYTVATKMYIAKGKDGFESFLDPSVVVLVDDKTGPCLPVIVRNYFRHLSSLSGYGGSSGSRDSEGTAESRRLLPRRHLVRKIRLDNDSGPPVTPSRAGAAALMSNDRGDGGAAEGADDLLGAQPMSPMPSIPAAAATLSTPMQPSAPASETELERARERRAWSEAKRGLPTSPRKVALAINPQLEGRVVEAKW